MNCYSVNTDSLYVCCYEEARYEKGIDDSVSNNKNTDEADWCFLLDDVIPFRNSMIYFMQFLSSGRFVFLGYHNVEASAFSAQQRADLSSVAYGGGPLRGL